MTDNAQPVPLSQAIATTIGNMLGPVVKEHGIGASVHFAIAQNGQFFFTMSIGNNHVETGNGTVDMGQIVKADALAVAQLKNRNGLKIVP